MATNQETARVESFSDGVFAIAITLLILEIRVPHLPQEASSAELMRALQGLWPSFVAFLGSFGAIMIMWVNHHGFFRMLGRSEKQLLFVNGLLLLMITFVPFPTSVLAAYLDRPAARMAAAFYCGTYVLVNICYNLLWFTAAHRRLFKLEIPAHDLLRVRNAYLFAFPIYLLATALSFWNTYVGLLMCLSLWVLWAKLRYV